MIDDQQEDDAPDGGSQPAVQADFEGLGLGGSGDLRLYGRDLASGAGFAGLPDRPGGTPVTALNWTYQGVILGPGVIRHEPLVGRDDHPGLQVLRCVVCGKPGWRGPKANVELGVRIMEQLIRPGYSDELFNEAGQLIMYEHYSAEVVGWVTSCGHVVWAGDWELVMLLGRIPRWEDRRIPAAERDKARAAAFARGLEG